MYGSLVEEQREALFQSVSGYWLSGIELGRLRAIVRDVRFVIDDWRESLPERQKPKKGEFIGILATIHFQQIGNYDDMEVAFHLWLENHEPFKRVTDEHGFYRVFAIIGSYTYKTTSIHTLIRLCAFLAQPITDIVIELAKLPTIGQLAVMPSEEARAEQKGLQQRQSKGTNAIKENTETFALTLGRYVAARHYWTDDQIIKSIVNTSPKSDAVTWEHGDKFKGRPWNARSKAKAAYIDSPRLRSRVRDARAAVNQKRKGTYSRQS